VRTLAWLAVGVAVCVVVLLASGGHLFLLPLILILPFGWFGARRR
jgi:EamA domain-containing membrane protein RarD